MKKVCKLKKTRSGIGKRLCLENEERVYALGQFGGLV